MVVGVEMVVEVWVEIEVQVEVRVEVVEEEAYRAVLLALLSTLRTSSLAALRMLWMRDRKRRGAVALDSFSGSKCSLLAFQNSTS